MQTNILSFGSRDVEAEAGSGKFSWKRKLEAVKGYASTLAIHIERQNLNVVQFLEK